LLLGSIGVFLAGLLQTQQADQAVRRTLNIMTVLGGMEKAVARKQSAYGGFVITGQAPYLASYDEGVKGLAERFAEARRLNVNPEMQQRLEAVRALNERLDAFVRTLTAIRQGAADASRAHALVASGIGRSLVESLQLELDQAMSQELRLLAERKSREVAARAVMTAALLLCLVGGILASVSQFLLMRRLDSQRRILVSEIAARKQVEENLIRAKERFRTILDEAPQPIIVSDPAGGMIEVNSATAAEFGYGREEMIGKPGTMLIPARYHGARAERREEILAELKGRSLGPDLVCVRKDGSEFPAVGRVCPMRTADGLQFITSLVNISERKEIEENLQRANTAFQAVNKELEAFAYSVSHDLRAPIRGMAGFSQILIEDFGPQLPPEAQDYLRVIQAEGQRMGQLIDDMLNLSRVTRTEMKRESVNLSALANEVLAALRKAAPERTAQCVVAEGLTATGDTRMLRILLDNLLGNAWKFTGRTAEPRIEFGSVSGNGSPAFFVRDNGAGFDMAYAGKLFAAFQRLHSSKEFPGTGIGLAIVQRIANRHGGRVWAEGAKGQGATFYFSL
jgi:PAS domain S-box-containing protein